MGIAADIEQETGIPCGKQDHYAGVLGGINLLRCNGESVKSTPLGLTEDALEELHDSLLLVYTGESHFSGGILQNVIDAYKLEIFNFCYTFLDFTNDRIDPNAPKASKDYRKCIRVEKAVEKHNGI